MSEVLELLSSELDEQRIREIAAHLGTDHAQTEAAIAAALPTLVSAMGRTAETDDGSQLLAGHMQGIGGGSLGDLLGGLLGAGASRRTPSQSDRSSAGAAASGGLDDILPTGYRDSTSRANANSPARNVPSNFDLPKSSSSSSLDRSLGPGNELPQSRRSQIDQDEVPSGAPSGSLDDVLGKVLGGKQKRVEDSIGKSSGLNLSKVGPLLAILAPLVLGAMRAKASSRSTSGSGFDPSDITSMMRGERKSIEQKAGGSLIGRMLDQDGDGDFDLSDIVKLGMKFFFSRR